MPTARPARMALIQVWRMESVTSAASARKIMAMAMFHVPKPQQAVEKQCMFKPAASPPSTQTIGANFNCRNRTQALNPSSNMVNGVKIFRNIAGEINVPKIVVRVGEEEGISIPIHQKSSQAPQKVSGSRLAEAMIGPNWVSLAHMM